MSQPTNPPDPVRLFPVSAPASHRCNLTHHSYGDGDLALRVRGALTIGSVSGAISTVSPGEPLDLRRCTFIDPVGLVTVAVVADFTHRGLQRRWLAPESNDTYGYMNRMGLPNVLHKVARIEPDRFADHRKWNRSDHLCELTYRPSTDEASDLGDLVFDRLHSSEDDLGQAVWTCVIEAWANINDHSRAKLGFAAAQVFERGTARERLVIGIADAGIGIAESLRDRLGDLTDEEAVLQAVGGVSSTGEVGRGQGLSSMRECVARELKGKLLVLSGYGGILAAGGSMRRVRSLSPLPGTIIGVELPCGER